MQEEQIMLKKLYINNFKCLEKFELDLDNLHSIFLLGKNGSGKTTIFEAIEIFQKIGRGTTALKELISESSFRFSDTSLPIEFKLEVSIATKKYSYELIIEFPEKFMYPRVKHESLSVNGINKLRRDGGSTSVNNSASFSLDWHHIGLPLISVQTQKDPINIFRAWLQNIIIISPFPRSFSTVSKTESVVLHREADNIIDWARWLLSSNPSLYVDMSDFLKTRMPDLEVFKFENLGKDDRCLTFTFADNSESTIQLDFSQLSDGEKIFFLVATVIAAQKHNPTILCLWDEPDNFISLVELDHMITSCRKAFDSSKSKGQLILTSHNERVINNFSNNNIFVLNRLSHLSSPYISPLKDIPYESKTIVDAYLNGELGE